MSLENSPEPEAVRPDEFSTSRINPLKDSFEILSREYIPELSSELVRYRRMRLVTPTVFSGMEYERTAYWPAQVVRTLVRGEGVHRRRIRFEVSLADFNHGE